MSFKLLAVAAVLATTPALAQDVLATHTELAVPGGKTPVKVYRPGARDGCTVGHRPHLSGKLPLTAAPTVDARDCADRVASREGAAKLGR